MNEELLALKKGIEKQFGSDTAIPAIDVTKKDRYLVPVSPALDIGLCGGVPSGSWVLLSGPEKAGKTTLALEIAKNAQKLFGFPTVLMNIEGRFKGQTTRAVEGLDLENTLVIESSEDKILTGEDFMTIAENILYEVPRCVLILDSVSRINTKASMDKEVSGTKRPTAPKLISDFVSRMSGVVPVQNSIVISIAQTYANISGYGSPISISVPSAVKYQADIILKIKKINEWKKKDEEKKERQIGHILDWEIVHNAIGPPPAGS
jgi:recombination protein RecA